MGEPFYFEGLKLDITYSKQCLLVAAPWTFQFQTLYCIQSMVPTTIVCLIGTHTHTYCNVADSATKRNIILEIFATFVMVYSLDGGNRMPKHTKSERNVFLIYYIILTNFT